MTELTYDMSQLTKNDALGCETSLSNNEVYDLTGLETSLTTIILILFTFLVTISIIPAIISTMDH
jgi:preprotein translocase subunit SecG